MRDLTANELLAVSGAGWFNEVTDFLQQTWNSIFSNPTPASLPPVSDSAISSLSSACVQGGGRPDLVVLSGTAGANVKVVNGNGSFYYAHFTCPK